MRCICSAHTRAGRNAGKVTWTSCIDKGSVCSVFKLGGLYNEMEHSFDKKMDIMTTQMLSDDFLRSIRGEEVLIYERG